MKTPIDLGYNMEGPTSVASSQKKMFPTLHLEWPTSYDLPESGELTVTFRKTHEAKSKDQNGKTRYTVDLEIQSINDVEEGEAEGHDETAEEESGAEALDRYKKEAEGE